MSPLRLQSLGALRLHDGEQELLAGRRRELLLLAYLARQAPAAMSRSELAALLWGERDEARARSSLRQALLKLRRALGELIEVSPDTVRLPNGAVELDAARFEFELAAGRAQEAVTIHRGEFLPGAEEVGTEPFRLWLHVERARLRRLVQGAYAQLAEAAEQRGEWVAAAAWTERWAATDPFDERVHARLVTLLRLGERAEAAAAVHAAFVARLRRELGEAPSREFALLDEPPRAASTAPTASPAEPDALPSVALFTPDLVGRGPSLAVLRAAWEDTAGAEPSRAGRVVLVEGEEGIGKTRLCEEFLRWLALAGHDALVLRARAFGAERERAWATTRPLLEGLLDAPGLAGAPPEALARLGRLVPAIRERFRRLPEPDGDDAASVDAVLRVLGDVGAEQPVVLWVDDLECADEATQRLLLALACHPPAGVLVLLTAQPGAGPAFVAAGELRRLPTVHRVALAPLTPEEVEALLASMLALAAAERGRLARRVHAETNGNPFYAIALVAALVDAGRVVASDDGAWRTAPGVADDALPLPAGVREAVRARLAHLGRGGRDVAAAAAVIGHAIDAELLEEVSALPPDEFADAVEELLARHLLREAPPPEQGYLFSHDLIGRVTYEVVSAPRRRTLHRRALQALARRPSTDASARAMRRHRERAGPMATIVWSRARLGAAACLTLLLAVMLVAARRHHRPVPAASVRPSLAVLYLQHLPADTAVAYLADGLTEEIASRLGLLERLRVKSPAAVRSLSAGVSDGPATVGQRLGVDYLVEGSLRRSGDRIRIAVRLVSAHDGFQRWTGSYDAGATALLHVQDTIAHAIAEQIAGRLLPEEQRALARRATTDPRAYDHLLRGNYHLARRTPASVQRAIEEYRQASRRDPALSAALAREAYGYALFADWGWSLPGLTSEELLARGLLLSEEALRRDSSSADAWMARGYLFVLRDPLRHAGAVDAFTRSATLDPHNAEAHHQLGQTLMVLGGLDEARAAYDRALAVEPTRAMTLVPIGAILARQRQPAEARRFADSAVAADPSVPYAYASRGIRRLQLGDAAGARRDAETALQLDRSFQLPARSLLAAALHQLGDTTGARAELAQARQALLDAASPTPTEMLYLAIALVLSGHADEALDLVERTRPRGAWLWFYLQEPLLDGIRDEPRVGRVLDEVQPLGGG